VLFVVNSAVQTYNVALNKLAYQSSNHIEGSVTYSASYGNDGNHHTHYRSSPYCAVTKNESNPWWAVDLGQPTAVYGVNLATSRATGRGIGKLGLPAYLLDL